MPPDSRPVVYCETNWIVALAFPHHARHGGAREVRDRARRGACVLRIPYAAFLEARNPLAEHSATLTNMIAGVNDALLHAFSNGWADADFATARTALTGGAMDRYLARQEPQTIVDDLLRDPHLTVLRDPTPALGMMDALRSILNFKGKDLVDLYILAAVIADRAAQDPDRPALFFSTNKKEFEPKGDPRTRLREQIYRPNRILWRDDFDVDQGVRHWEKEFRVAPIVDR